MLVGGVTGLVGLITSHPMLKLIAICALGLGVVISCVPLLFFLGAIILGKRRERERERERE